MPEPGVAVWRSPLGHHYLRDHTGTDRCRTRPADDDPAPDPADQLTAGPSARPACRSSPASHLGRGSDVGAARTWQT